MPLLVTTAHTMYSPHPFFLSPESLVCSTCAYALTYLYPLLTTPGGQYRTLLRVKSRHFFPDGDPTPWSSFFLGPRNRRNANLSCCSTAPCGSILPCYDSHQDPTEWIRGGVPRLAARGLSSRKGDHQRVLPSGDSSQPGGPGGPRAGTVVRSRPLDGGGRRRPRSEPYGGALRAIVVFRGRGPRRTRGHRMH